MVKPSWVFSLAVAAAVVAPHRTAGADCAQAFPVAELVLPGAVAPSAALLMRVTVTHGEPKDRQADPMKSLTARLVRAGHDDIPLKVEVLAPNLGRLVPARKPAPGPWK